MLIYNLTTSELWMNLLGTSLLFPIVLITSVHQRFLSKWKWKVELFLDNIHWTKTGFAGVIKLKWGVVNTIFAHVPLHLLKNKCCIWIILAWWVMVVKAKFAYDLLAWENRRLSSGGRIKRAMRGVCFLRLMIYMSMSNWSNF